jgi:hypothetical protein
MTGFQRWQYLAAAVWLGLLLTVAGIATPAPFATLAKADAGRVVARVLAHEAAVSLVMGAVILVLHRARARQRASLGQGGPQFDLNFGLAAAAVFCTLAGYYAVQPLMLEARAGQGALSFAQLHAISGSFYALKVGLVAALAWRLTRPASSSP